MCVIPYNHLPGSLSGHPASESFACNYHYAYLVCYMEDDNNNPIQLPVLHICNI